MPLIDISKISPGNEPGLQLRSALTRPVSGLAIWLCLVLALALLSGCAGSTGKPTLTALEEAKVSGIRQCQAAFPVTDQMTLVLSPLEVPAAARLEAADTKATRADYFEEVERPYLISRLSDAMRLVSMWQRGHASWENKVTGVEDARPDDVPQLE